MNKQEELTYLFGIMSEASKWTRSSDDDRDSVRMEVEERIQRLLGNGGEPDENGVIQSVVHPDKEETEPGEFVEQVSKAPSRKTLSSREARRRYVQTHTRAWFDGKQSFYPNDQVSDIMLPNNRIKHVHKDSNEYKKYLEAHPSMLNGGDNG